MKRWPAIAALLAALSGCAPLAQRPDAPPVNPAQQQAWQQRSERLAQVDRFTVTGRVASSALGFKADLRWKQNPDGTFAMRVAGPFGARAAELSGDPSWVQVRTGDDTTYTADPEAWLAQAIGCRIPVIGLRWWALGLPSPGTTDDLVLDASGRAAFIRQNGWELAYTEYAAADGLDLPRRIEAKSGDTRVLLIADRWTDLAP
ncbi:MAG TPA: lipoprotein insertase outer membrane protein LolB [Nevskiaceae bacterium]|nr:lipoprotein insertase outer membrane protein LolB [Nevskiaceae bacterium]